MKRIISILLLLSIMVMGSGCGKNSGKEDSSNTGVNESGGSVTETETAQKNGQDDFIVGVLDN